MKLTTICAALVPLVVAHPVFAHHMAEGIVADDIYAAIEENLGDTPHVTMDLTMVTDRTAMISMTVPTADVATVLQAIADTLPGSGQQLESSLEVDISQADAEGMVEITITERMGSGNSQVIPLSATQSASPPRGTSASSSVRLRFRR
jgi:hypothetical protein